MYYSTTYESPVGLLTLACDDEALCGLWIEGQKYHGASVPGDCVPRDDAPALAMARAWLDAYFAGENPAIEDVPLAPRGSAFRQAVWRELCKIPYGTTTTYGAIAREVARTCGKASAIAVGGAVGHNPISIIVPCHRVVGASGSLTGYAGGLDKKAWLLQHEGSEMEGLYRPKRGTAL